MECPAKKNALDDAVLVQMRVMGSRARYAKMIPVASVKRLVGMPT